jgi:hypothetical protein
MALASRILLIGGFGATFISGFAPIGFLAVWAGCGLGLPGSKQTRWLGGLGLSTGLLMLSLAVGSGVTTFSADPALLVDESQPFLEVRVESWNYANGELRVQGTVENTGAGPAFSPAIELLVFEGPEQEELLASDTAYPDGGFDREFHPGQDARFQHALRILDPPVEIFWEIVVDQYPSDIRGGL